MYDEEKSNNTYFNSLKTSIYLKKNFDVPHPKK